MFDAFEHPSNPLRSVLLISSWFAGVSWSHQLCIPKRRKWYEFMIHFGLTSSFGNTNISYIEILSESHSCHAMLPIPHESWSVAVLEFRCKTFWISSETFKFSDSCPLFFSPWRCILQCTIDVFRKVHSRVFTGIITQKILTIAGTNDHSVQFTFDLTIVRSIKKLICSPINWHGTSFHSVS